MYLLASEVHVQFVYSFNTRLYCFNKLHHYNAIRGCTDTLRCCAWLGSSPGSQLVPDSFVQKKGTERRREPRRNEADQMECGMSCGYSYVRFLQLCTHSQIHYFDATLHFNP